MTTSTVRPASTIRNGSNLVGGASLYGVISDNSDATLAQCNADNKIRFGNASLPAGAIVDHVVLRLRTSRPPGEFPIAFCNLNNGPFIQIKPTTNDPTYATQSSAPQGGFTAAAVAAGVTLEWSTGVGDVFNLTEAYLDVTYIAVPTVDVTAPSGTIAVTRPTVTWDFTGTYPQSHYQVKIFTQTQFNSPGFNPSTSSAFYDSVVQTGTADELTPTANLINGDTYRVYVRVAQRVGSTTQWSEWDFEQTTVTATPPSVPTLTAVADDTLARIKLTVTETDPWEFVTIQRTSDGTVWESVRSTTRAPVFGDTFVAYDYESSNQQDVQYRALAISTVGASDVASDWSASTAPTSWTSTETWLKAPLAPGDNSPVKINELPTLKRRLPQGTFDVASRRDPIVVSDTRHLTEGTVTFAVTDDLAPILTLLNRSEILLLQTPPEDQVTCLYMAVGDVDENRVSRRSNREERLVVCPFVEVLAPVGDLIGSGVTWQDIIDSYADWDAVATANVSWLELLDQ